MNNVARTFLLTAVLMALLLFAACAPIAAPSAPAAPVAPGDDASAASRLTAQPWQWVAFTSPEEGVSVETPERYQLTFGEDGIVEIVADCNTAIASYGVDGTDAGSLTMSVAPRTTDICPPESRGDQFLELLGGAASYFYRDGQLYIDLFADGSTMVFVPSAAETPTGGVGGAAGNAQAMLVEMLGNLTYSGLFPERTITLTNGRADYEEEGPGTPYVSLVDQLAAVGDLDGDGAEDAVALLEDHSSGSGTFLFLAAVLDATGDPTPTTALMIGDRIQVKSLAIEDGRIVAELIAHGDGDPACCPTWNVRKRFALQNGALMEISSEELSQVTLADLNGTRWRLVDLGEGQAPLLSDTEITLFIDDGQVTGSAGCNDYTGSVAGDANVLQSFTVGPSAATQRLCPDPGSAQEAAYLSLLSSVLGWRYDGGYLTLAYPAGDSIYAYLRFEPL